jgi:O-methyltransferase involved in polyketide biosynthesis
MNTRVETASLRTAAMTCLARAASYVDKRECYVGSDSIAYLLVPMFFKLLLKSARLFKLFSHYFFPSGIYEYVIARTKYFDEALREQSPHRLHFEASHIIALLYS